MRNHSHHLWQHDHVFGQDQIKTGEPRTMLVIAITLTMMIIEIGTGMPSVRWHCLQMDFKWDHILPHLE